MKIINVFCVLCTQIHINLLNLMHYCNLWFVFSSSPFFFSSLSYMETETEDSSVGICNGSLGREIMQVVQKNDKQMTNIKVCYSSRYYN